MEKESNTRQVPAEIDTEKNRGLRAKVYRFDRDGKVIADAAFASLAPQQIRRAAPHLAKVSDSEIEASKRRALEVEL